MKWQKRKKRLNPNTLQLIQQVAVGLILFLFFALIVVSVWYGTRIDRLTITDVAVSGGETIDHSLVKNVAEAALEGEYLRLVPKRFSFLYPRATIISGVEKIDRIKNISVTRSSFQSLQITFDEYVPDALWCTNETSDCVFLDEAGYAFARAPELRGGAFLRFQKLGVEPVTGVQAFDSSEYQQLKSLAALLDDQSWYVGVIEVDAAGDAYLTLTEGGELKVVIADEPTQIIDNLFTVLAAEKFTELGPGGFEYIDLRFGNKVFVNELDPEPTEDLATSTTDELE